MACVKVDYSIDARAICLQLFFAMVSFTVLAFVHHAGALYATRRARRTRTTTAAPVRMGAEKDLSEIDLQTKRYAAPRARALLYRSASPPRPAAWASLKANHYATMRPPGVCLWVVCGLARFGLPQSSPSARRRGFNHFWNGKAVNHGTRDLTNVT